MRGKRSDHSKHVRKGVWYIYHFKEYNICVTINMVVKLDVADLTISDSQFGKFPSSRTNDFT